MVICGVTCSFKHRVDVCVEMVLFTVVWIGIWAPCFTTAMALFWVTSCGLDSSLPTPLDSAAVMM